jgi:hypothetical protein
MLEAGNTSMDFASTDDGPAFPSLCRSHRECGSSSFLFLDPIKDFFAVNGNAWVGIDADTDLIPFGPQNDNDDVVADMH